MTNLPCNLGCETAEEHELRSAAMTAVDLPNLVRPKGVWRDQKLPCSLILSFPDVPTDDDMRAWHEAADTLSAMADERKDWARRFKLNGLTPWDWMTRAERAEASGKAWEIMCRGKQKIIDKLEAERDDAVRAQASLRLEIESMRSSDWYKDAERYRWLRGRVSGREYRRLGILYGEPSDVDAAIDTARKL